MIEFIIVVCAVLFFLVMQAFFSGSEMAMVSIEKNYLRHQAAMGSRGAKYALSMLNRPEWMLSTTLIGTNIATVCNTTIVSAYALSHFGDKGAIFAILILSPLVWLFAEIIPKSIFQQKSHQIVPIAIYGLWFFSFMLSPIVLIFSMVSRLINRNTPDASSPFIQRQELIAMIKTPDIVNGDIEEIEKDMIQRVFSFSETTAEQAMTPLEKVKSISKHATVAEALTLSQAVRHTRLPVYDKDPSKIIGILNTMEILGEDDDRKISDFILDAFYTQADTSIAQLLSNLRVNKFQLAIVTSDLLNKQNAIGLISLEDIMEEVVADIEDEYDEAPQMVRQLGARKYLVNARIPLDQLSQSLGVKLDKGKAVTLAGMLLEHFNTIPAEGDSVVIDELCYTVDTASLQAILEVQITW